RLEGRKGGRDHVVQLVEPYGLAENLIFILLLGDRVPWSGDQKPGGGHYARIIRRDLIAGDLLENELIVGLVAIERVDDVIPVSPGVEAVVVVLPAVGLAEANHVQPVTAPALPVIRRGQQPVYRMLVKFPEIFRLRRQTDQVEAQPAQQRNRIGAWRKIETL